MKPAILVVFLSAVFAGHYLAHAQTFFIETEGPGIFLSNSNLGEIEEKAHEAYTGPSPVPVFGEEAVKNYEKTHEALRQHLASECVGIQEEVVVRIALDEKGKMKASHIHNSPSENEEGLNHVFEQLSLKKALVKGVNLLDLKFNFLPAK